MNRVRLNATSLREQNEQLQTVLSFLPTLELRKRQLTHASRDLAAEVEAATAAVRRHAEEALPWLPLLHADLDAVRTLVGDPVAHTTRGQRAGVEVPILDRVTFDPAPYSRLGTPVLFDAAIAWLQQGRRLQLEVETLAEQQRRIQTELRRTTQRINLYEQVLIPEARANIRRIRAYLGDQLTAAVCRAKLAKGRLVRRGEGPDGRR